MNPTLDALVQNITAKRLELVVRRPFSTEALLRLQKHYDVDLTYTSNALEGNTLTLRETAEVIEHGLTVGGKPLRDHLEAVDHYHALLWMRDLAAQGTPLSEDTIRELHRRIVLRSQPEIGGVYSSYPRRIAGSSALFPNPAKIPSLMRFFGESLAHRGPLPAAAFEAHYELVAIHPFPDGNGRTARLLMNLLLLRNGYPPLAVRPADRLEYLAALEHASLENDLAPFQLLLHTRLDATLTEYLGALEGN